MSVDYRRYLFVNNITGGEKIIMSLDGVFEELNAIINHTDFKLFKLKDRSHPVIDYEIDINLLF